MFTSMSIATTGLQAASMRLEASAANVANARTSGPLPGTPPDVAVGRPENGERRVYQAVDVVQSSLDGGGVRAQFTQRLPAYTPAYDPYSPDADENGYFAMPNVDLAGEITEQMLAVINFEANIKMLKVASEMTKSVLDMKT
jgi:flagellar basal-body rod protein FlgC